MQNYRQTKLAFIALLALVGGASLLTHKTLKADEHDQDAITLASLSGPWQMTLTGDTGCGISTSVVTFNLDAYGSSSATIQIAHLRMRRSGYHRHALHHFFPESERQWDGRLVVRPRLWVGPGNPSGQEPANLQRGGHRKWG